MKLFKRDDMAFVELRRDSHCKYMLCIGTYEDTLNATDEEIFAMVATSLAMAEWRSIESSVHRTVH